MPNQPKITTLDERVKTAEKSIDNQAALNRDLVNKLRACKKKKNAIKVKQDKAEKERRKCSMIIHGVPENKDRHPRTIIQKLFMDLKMSVNIEDCEAVFRMGPVPRNPKSVRPIMVTLNKSSDKGKIYTKVINLKGLEKWRGTTIADYLSPDQLKDKRRKNLYEATLCREFGVGLRLHQFVQINKNSPGANKFGLCLMEIRYDLFYANEKVLTHHGLEG